MTVVSTEDMCTYYMCPHLYLNFAENVDDCLILLFRQSTSKLIISAFLGQLEGIMVSGEGKGQRSKQGCAGGGKHDVNKHF